MSGNWIGVAAAAHVARGRAGGFMQLCHGKSAPLRRVQPGDRLVYYSPSFEFRGKDKLRAFTAIGIVKEETPYPFDMGSGFCPWRRDVAWLPASEAPIAPLLDRLDFTSQERNWGYRLRAGLIAIYARDLCLIAEAMQASLPG
jgi:hypothetical protein